MQKYLIKLFQNPSANAVVFLEVRAIAFLKQIVAEHDFIEKAHRIHFNHHGLSIHEDVFVGVIHFGGFVIPKVGIDYGLLTCG